MTDDNRDIVKQPAQSSQARKPYKAPELLRWGTMRDITLSTGTTSTVSDGAMKSPNKTH
jgi:hypothetical protein